MLLIESIIIVLLFAALCKNAIKKQPVVFYILAALLTIGYMKIAAHPNLKEFNPIFLKYVFGPLNRAALGSAFIVVVMYIGVLKKEGFVKELMQIRGELAIIGSILIFGHNILFGKFFFVTFFTDMSSLPPLKLIATIVSIIMIVLLIPLFITSFRSVRKRMSGKTWKQLQKFAYLFFYLIYVHVMLLYLGRIQETIIEMIIYTIIWGYYTIKLIQKKTKKLNK